MDKLSLTLIILNVIILVLTVLWASRDKGFESKIAVLVAVAGLITIIFDDVNQKKDEILYQNQLGNLGKEVKSCIEQNTKLEEENTKLEQKIVQLGNNNTVNKTTKTTNARNENVGSGQQSSIQGDKNATNTGNGQQNAIIGNENKQINNPVNSVSLIDSHGNTINIKEDEKPAIKKEISVSEDTDTGIELRAGDRVQIKATGSIRVGAFLGHSGPEGIQCYMCERYNIVKQFKHGSLMFKRSGLSSWEYCGQSRVFTVASPGELSFEINDNEQGNNIGYYVVEIQVFRK
ncbi:MAG: hypothetical protein SFV22_08620 [Saprospiraceae bacterium]|nr:hypothetical protein [Saprospiraceae bacterium]